jgi:hypothetical protein
MKAVTIRQPWARAVAGGFKTVENRGRPASHRGEIAIHAARAHDPAGDTDPRILRLYGPNPSIGVPTGAVLAVADLVDCHLATGPCMSRACREWGQFDYADKPAYHLVLANVRPLERPVPARGALQVGWTLPADIEAQVRAQLAEEAPRCP